jgi:membrane associated rhomboid family serine protease
MTILEHPRTVILVGFILVLMGVILPLLMVLDVVKSSFILNFISYGASVAGLLLGVVGAATYVRTKRSRINKDE